MLFGGRTVFRELLQHADGTLGCRWVPEMSGGNLEISPRRMRLAGGVGAASAVIELPAGEGVLSGSLAAGGAGRVRFAFGDAADAVKRTLDFEPAGHQVSLDRGRSVIAFELGEREISWRICCRGEVLDVELDGRRAVVAPGPALRCDRLTVAVDSGTALVEISGQGTV